jgi:hypothetical protein
MWRRTSDMKLRELRVRLEELEGEYGEREVYVDGNGGDLTLSICDVNTAEQVDDLSLGEVVFIGAETVEDESYKRIEEVFG